MPQKRKPNGIEVVIDHKHEPTYKQDAAPKYYQVGITPQAPLKPIQKQAYDSFIDDLLDPDLPLKWLKEMYTKPLPALMGQLRCTLERKKSSGLMDMFSGLKFVLSLSEEGQTILTARKEKHNKHSVEFPMKIEQERFTRMNKAELKTNELDLSTLKSDVQCQTFVLPNPSQILIRNAVGENQMQNQVLKQNPSQVKAFIPMVDSDGKILVNIGDLQERITEKRLTGIAEFGSKAPVWNAKTQEYALNFGTRVSEGSMKNMQLVDKYDDSKLYLQFGKF